MALDLRIKNRITLQVLGSFTVANCISMSVLKTNTYGTIKEGQKEYLDDKRPKQP